MPEYHAFFSQNSMSEWRTRFIPKKRYKTNANFYILAIIHPYLFCAVFHGVLEWTALLLAVAAVLGDNLLKCVYRINE